MEISLTDFVEFTLKTGSARLTKIKQIKERPNYHPSFDYWKILRDKIIDYHQNHGNNLNVIEEILENIKNKAKRDNYRSAIDNYNGFVKKRELKWFDPPYSLWRNSELIIRINPELGLLINNQNHIIKLYFGSDKISKIKINMILTLMELEFANYKEKSAFGLLDIKSRKLHVIDKNESSKIFPLIIGEAFAFEHIWNNI